jgi:hypothetical protein
MDIQVCKSISHFNWFARYDAKPDEKKWPKETVEKTPK